MFIIFQTIVLIKVYLFAHKNNLLYMIAELRVECFF